MSLKLRRTEQKAPPPQFWGAGLRFPQNWGLGGGGVGAFAATLLFAALLASAGCGNQMYRQLSYTPLDSPRAAPPQDSVPVDPSRAPTDARAVVSPAYGAKEASAVVALPSSFPSKEPDLPPPNLSDNARYQEPPAQVNVIRDPFPTDPRLADAGRVVFLNRCVQCHNANGTGYGVVGSYLVPHPPDLASNLVQHISDGAIFWHITMGQGKMPGFRHWLTPSERWTLVQYVRTLKNADPNKGLLDAHVSDTRGTPYPVYGEPNYEKARNEYPFKALGRPATAAQSRVFGDSTEPPEYKDSEH